MKIYQDRCEIEDFPRMRKSKPGSFWTRLIGIHISAREDLVVEPIYQPFIRIEMIGRVLLIEISTHKPIFDIWLSTRKPFIQTYRPKGYYLDE